MTKTAILFRAEVFDDKGERVGKAYMIVTSKGKVLDPVCSSDEGKGLPAEWYNLSVAEKEDLVVISETIQ